MLQSVLILSLTLVAQAAPPKSHSLAGKGANEKYIVYPGLDVDNNVVATWMNGYASPWNVAFGNQPYVVGWVGEDEEPWGPYNDAEDYTEEDYSDDVSVDTGVDVPHDQVIADRVRGKKGKKPKRDVSDFQANKDINELSKKGSNRRSKDLLMKRKERSVEIKRPIEALMDALDLTIDAPHDHVNLDRRKLGARSGQASRP